jgi:hypothetical protein
LFDSVRDFLAVTPWAIHGSNLADLSRSTA